MNIKQMDYEFKDKVIDIIERIQMLREDLAYEMVERKTADNFKDIDIFFLQPLIYDLVNCIDILDRYRHKQ